MKTDNRGLPYTCASTSALQNFEETIAAFFRMGMDVGPKLKAVFEADPEMPMAHCLKGYFMMLMAMGKLVGRARECQKTATSFSSSASARELAHIRALEFWCDDRKSESAIIWEEILQEFPRDPIALKMLHHAYFYWGRADAMKKSMAEIIPHWGQADPLYSYLLGMQSFALEECGDYAKAEEAGRKAVDINAEDPWSIHAVAHIMEMQSRYDEGVTWISDLEPNWDSANNFRYHLYWHRALMVLGKGEFDRALQIFDEELWDETSDECLDFCNNASLLQRLEFYGVDVGDRWSLMHEKVQSRVNDHLFGFFDAHFALILAANEDEDHLGKLISSFDEKGGDIRMNIAASLCKAIAEYRRGEYATSKSALMALTGEIVKIGGSHAQRDLFELLLIEAAIKSEDYALAQHMLENRTLSNPKSGLNWKKLSTVLDAMGDKTASEADKQANKLLIS